MILDSITYSQFKNTPKEWSIDKLSIQPTNLIVGKNASGKSRTLSIINGIAKLLSGEFKLVFQSGDYQLNFADGKIRTEYFLTYANARVEREILTINDKTLLRRESNGEGTIFAEQLKQTIQFQTPPNELAAVARRDSIQHTFFEPLYEWAKALHFYRFNTTLGKNNYAAANQKPDLQPDPRDPEQVISIFTKGEREFGSAFTQKIFRDMKQLGYGISAIGTRPPQSVLVSRIPFGIGDVLSLYVKEDDLSDVTEQSEISDGMFRALSVLILVNYSLLTSKPSCVLIDDIGEGLDYERSTALIELLMGRLKESNVQLVMSSNDRFVMNKVPLSTWSVLYRHGGRCSVYNYENSREKFESFKFTGLNNFDFFSTDYVIDSKTHN